MLLCSDALKFINENRNSTFFVGLSGGVDSIALLVSLVRLGLNCHALHVNHGISHNSKKWEDFCTDFCDRLGVPIDVENLNLDRNLANLECVARNKRYSFFENHAGEGGIVVTAHHMDDQVETFLLAAKRGSGIDGLSSMPMVKSGNYTHFRPFLSKPKEEITQFVIKAGFDWVEDESNNSSEYDRNFIRNEVIPLLQSRWGNITKRINLTVQMCSASRSALTKLVTEKYKQCSGPNKMLSLSNLKKSGDFEVQIFVLREWLRDNGLIYMPSEKVMNQIKSQFLSSNSPKSTSIVTVSKEACVRIYRGYLRVTPIDIDRSFAYRGISISLGVSVEDVICRAGGNNSNDARRVKVDGKGWLLNDYLHYLGIEPWLRDFVPVELDGESLIWPKH